MLYFMDSEFIEDGKTIDLISIGIVCEDGREYYAQSVEFNADNASYWVWDKVIPALNMHESQFGKHAHLKPYHESLLSQSMRQHRDGQCEDEEHGKYAACPWRTRAQIANELCAFIDPEKYGAPEFWTYYGAYDHVALAQLYGPMIDLPKGWPMYTHDLMQWCDMLGNPQLPVQSKGEHNALADAKHNRVMWEFLNNLSKNS